MNQIVNRVGGGQKGQNPASPSAAKPPIAHPPISPTHSATNGDVLALLNKLLATMSTMERDLQELREESRSNQAETQARGQSNYFQAVMCAR